VAQTALHLFNIRDFQPNHDLFHPTFTIHWQGLRNN